MAVLAQPLHAVCNGTTALVEDATVAVCYTGLASSCHVEA